MERTRTPGDTGLSALLLCLLDCIQTQLASVLLLGNRQTAGLTMKEHCQGPDGAQQKGCSSIVWLAWNSDNTLGWKARFWHKPSTNPKEAALTDNNNADLRESIFRSLF